MYSMQTFEAIERVLAGVSRVDVARAHRHRSHQTSSPAWAESHASKFFLARLVKMPWNSSLSPK